MNENPYEPPKTPGELASEDSIRGPWWSRPRLAYIGPLAIVATVGCAILGHELARSLAEAEPGWVANMDRYGLPDLDDHEAEKALAQFRIEGFWAGLCGGLGISACLFLWYFGAMTYRAVHSRKYREACNLPAA